MKTAVLPGTDMLSSVVALGTDSFGLTLPEKESFAMLDAYVAMGGNMIDTALSYSDWVQGEKSRSEKLIGRWLFKRGSRSRVLLSTKGGHPPMGHMEIPRLSRKDIESDIEKSLRHLGCDYVDIYWLHRDTGRLPVGEIMETLHDLVKVGKTRFFGLSNWTHERIDEANAYAEKHGLTRVIAGQIQHSVARGIPENNDPTLVLMNQREYAYYAKHHMPVFAYASQAKGFFSKLDAGGLQALGLKARTRYLSEDNLKRYALLKEFAGCYKASVGQLAIAALTSDRHVLTFPIVGCKTVEQLSESMSGADITLEQNDVDRLFLLQ